MENITQLYASLYKTLLAIRADEQNLAQEKQNIAALKQQEEARIKADYENRRQQVSDDLQNARNLLSAAQTYARDAKVSVSPQAARKKPDFALMQQLFVQIDDTDPNDPNAKRLLEAATAAISYLEASLRQLDQAENADLVKISSGSAVVSQTQKLTQSSQALRQRYDDLLSGSTMQRLYKAVRSQADAYFIDKNTAYDQDVPAAASDMMKFGVIQRPFPVRKEFIPRMQAMFGVYYDVNSRTLRLPYGFRTDKAVRLEITAPDTANDRVRSALCGILFNILRHYEPLSGRVTFLDPATYNPDHLLAMKPFAAPDSLIRFPTSDSQASRLLDQLVDEALDDDEQRFLIIRGYPGNLSSEIRGKIRTICHNSAQYRVSVILTRVPNAYQDPQDAAAMSGAMNIDFDGQYFNIKQNGKSALFSFFAAPQTITDSMIQRFADAYLPHILGSEYPNRVDLKQIPPYTKGSKQIRLPFGVDKADQLCDLDFYNTNFSMYLMGAAGSGKSTLLHSIITGLIRNYHPDDVELWLADFKMGEFAQYMNPMPPHVKYILLDESPELICDFIELLTEKLMERKRFFSTHNQYKELESVPADIYMPTIFVIIDEFTIMSQVIANSDRHKMLLQDLLVQGRNAGFKFIFSSQEYTKGVAGLTATAKDQIQTRIAMKNTVDEIKATLDIPGSQLTTQMRDWIDTLPPHVALYKSFDRSQGKITLERAQVLYFPKQNGSAYGIQQNMIRTLKKRLTPVSRKQFSPTNPAAYVEKQPVVANGTSYGAFTAPAFHKAVEEYKRANPDDFYPDDIFLSLGNPRRLLSSSLTTLLCESRENMLLFTGQEVTCSMSVILSAIRSFLLQNGTVQIWAHRRSRLYRTYAASHFSKCTALDTAEAIGSAIEDLKEKIKAHTQGNQLIVLLGMDRICEELQQADFRPSAADALRKATVSTEQEQQDYQVLQKLTAEMNEELDRIMDEGLDNGWTTEEINAKLAEVRASYLKKQNMYTEPPPDAPAAAVTTPKADYIGDFQYILNKGSRCGYHFLLCCKDRVEFRQAQCKTELFNHRFAFQVAAEDASLIFGSNRASKLPQHVCLYQSDYHTYTFRPFLHRGVTWDDWEVDENGNATHFIYKPK